MQVSVRDSDRKRTEDMNMIEYMISQSMETSDERKVMFDSNVLEKYVSVL